VTCPCLPLDLSKSTLLFLIPTYFRSHQNRPSLLFLFPTYYCPLAPTIYTLLSGPHFYYHHFVFKASPFHSINSSVLILFLIGKVFFEFSGQWILKYVLGMGWWGWWHGFSIVWNESKYCQISRSCSKVNLNITWVTFTVYMSSWSFQIHNAETWEKVTKSG